MLRLWGSLHCRDMLPSRAGLPRRGMLRAGRSLQLRGMLPCRAGVRDELLYAQPALPPQAQEAERLQVP